MKIIALDSVDSTNSWLSRRAKDMDGECLVYALEQTCGRGQRGNVWESEPGANLTTSLLLHPDGIEPACQFVVSEAVALAVVDVLRSMGVEAKVKWPNDIYAGDSKVCGILIENAVMGRMILHSIAGVGINLNQMMFLSDAPNPVSVRQLTGKTQGVAEAASLLAACVSSRLGDAVSDPDRLHQEYLSLLWRGDGKMYPFSDRLTGETYMGRIHGIAPDGMLTIADAENVLRRYAFKEVEFLLENQ